MGYFSRSTRHGAQVQISEQDGVRLLHLGGPAVQSAMRLRNPYDLELEYTRAMMAFVLFHPEPRELALLGLGGGSIAKFIHRRLPDCRLTALEIDPEVVAAARAYFLLPENDARLRVEVDDGARYVQRLEQALDVLLVDAYDAHRIAEDLATTEFYGHCLRALRPGGVAVYNLWGSDRRFDTYRRRLLQVFDGRILELPAEQKANVVVFAFKPPLPEMDFIHLCHRAEAWQRDLGLEFPRFLERMRARNPGTGIGFNLSGAPGRLGNPGEGWENASSC